MFRFIHAADIHLDSPLHGLVRYEGAPVEEIRSATRRAFNNLVELAINEGVDFVLLAGDLYDGDWKDYDTGLYFVEKMGHLREAGIPVFMVAGNHDAASQITKHLRLPDNVKSFSTSKPDTFIIDNLGVSIHGQGFSKREITDNLSETFPQASQHHFNIGLLHTCLDGKPGHAAYAPCSIDDLRSKGYQYWALGHIHKREEVCRDPWIVFPGNVQGRHIRETGSKGCTLVTVEDAEVTDVEHHDLDVLRWSRCDLDVSGCETTDDILDRVRDGLQETLDAAQGRPVAVRLELQGRCEAHATLHAEWEHWVQEYRALANDSGGAGIWLEKAVLKTSPKMSTEDALERNDAFGGLLRTIHNMELGSDALEMLADELSPLCKKLPAEMQRGEDSYNPADPKQIQNALEDIKEILVNRLLISEQLP